MSRKPAPTKATGGGGFTFADKVAAFFAAQMLGRELPLGANVGPISGIHFETRESGWLLDDLLLDFSQSDHVVRCALSVKSNVQLTEAGFPPDFVKDIWEQWRGVPGSTFNRSQDLLGLAVADISGNALTAWNQLLNQAIATQPETEPFLKRLEAGSGQSSDAQRRIFKSIYAPSERIPGGPPTDEESAQLARLRLFHRDFESQSSTALSEAINLSSKLTSGNNLRDGETLWGLLLELGAENRGLGGYLNIPKVITELRGKIMLKDYPDYAADWDVIKQLSLESSSRVRRTVGPNISIERTAARTKVSQQINAEKRLALVGESGSGKSAVMAQIVDESNQRRVLWLNRADLDQPSQLQLARNLGLRNTFSTLMAASVNADNWVVIDGFEQLIGNAKARAVELIKIAAAHGWNVVVTCQPQFWSDAEKSFLETGLQFNTFPFDQPSAQEIIKYIQAVPGLGALFLRSDLAPILSNLAVLDQVIKAQLVQPFSPPRAWVGESDVIDWIWNYWIGSGPQRHARADLLRQLGETDGDKLSGGTPLKSVAPTSLGLVGELEGDGLLRVTDTAIEFSHDLLAEWARLRVLIVADDEAPRKIREQAVVPRWIRAIRLYAQRLIEQGSGLAEWKAKLAQLGGEGTDAINARDLFIDGILFATNAQSILEQVWPEIAAADGDTLQRLLKRLLHAATIPDWRFQVVIDREHSADAAVWFRIPNPLYWIPVLSILGKHTKDVSTLAVMVAAEVCELWLRTMPNGLAGRPEAARLALDLAKEAQGLIAEGFHLSGERYKNIFAALLYAAPEFPDEVSEVALELSARRGEPKHAIERAIAAEERRETRHQEYLLRNPSARKRAESFPGVSSFRFSREMRPPAADGPERRVEDAFQSAVLDTMALDSLVTVRPAVAREVLLACCIDEPREIKRAGSPIMPDLGLTHWDNRLPDLYSKGPFLSFLKTSPQEGLEAIIRLVNHATDRWLEAAAGPAASTDDRKKFGLEFPLNDKDAFFLTGNCSVFSWSRYGEMNLELVVCALMALEKWLYDEMEKGNDLDQTIKLILTSAHSLSFAGVLVSLGLKHQGLFAGVLRPFLGSMLLYSCQWDLASSESQNLWKIQLNYRGNLDARLVKMFVDWHAMPHRQLRLRDVAQWIMMQHKPTFDFVTARRQLFLSSLKSPELMDSGMKALMTCFDPANYYETELPDGRIQTEFRVPEDIQEETRESQKRAELEALAFLIPSQSRQYLSKGKQLMPEEADEFLSKLQRLADHASEIPDDSKPRVDDALAGGIAVLVTQHLPWVNRNPESKTWCLKTLKRLSSKSRPAGYSRNDVLSISAETFLGEAAVALLTESDYEYLRVAVFNAITGFYYNSTSHTIWAAYHFRSKLGNRFEVLLNVMTQWAALRRAATQESVHTGEEDWLEKYRQVLRKRFLAGSIPTSFISLERVELLGKRLLRRIARREERRWHHPGGHPLARDDEIYRDPPPLDTKVLQKGFTFLGVIADSTSHSDIREFTSYVRSLFEMEMRTMPKVDPDSSGNQEIQGTPYEYEHWIWQLTALAITRTESTDLQRGFWQPILDLGATAHYWVRDFFRAWFDVGLPCCGDPLDRFAGAWRQMAEYTFESRAWNPEGKRFWFHLNDLAVDLMGLRDSKAVLGDSIGALLRESRYRPLVEKMQSTFEHWADRWLKQETAAMWFAHFLPSDSGLVLMTMGIKKIAAVIGDLPKRDWDRGDLGYALAMALRACWTHHKADLHSDAELHLAFKAILSELVGRMEPHALQLQTEIAGTLRNL